MPLFNGLDASRQILKENPSACILLLTVHSSRQLMEEAKKAGIKGFCYKASSDCFFEAVETLLRGETYFRPPEITLPPSLEGLAQPAE